MRDMVEIGMGRTRSPHMQSSMTSTSFPRGGPARHRMFPLRGSWTPIGLKSRSWRTHRRGGFADVCDRDGSSRRSPGPQRRRADRAARRRGGEDRPGPGGCGKTRRNLRRRSGCFQQFHAAPLDPDLLGEAVSRIRDAGVTTAVRVSPQNAQALTPALVSAGIDLLIIQGTIISAERVAQDGEPLNLKTFISELDIPVVAGGGVLDHRTALHLMRTGAAGVIVGYGSTAGDHER